MSEENVEIVRRAYVPFAHLIDMRAGRATGSRMYSDQPKALEAAGLSE
jgi:hypothetical protein